MKKLKLNLDELTVETFAAVPHEARLGTVAGQEFSQNCGNSSICTGGSCDGTCYATCGDAPCATYYNQCPTVDGADSCASACFNTDNENTCLHTCLYSCSCDWSYCC